MTEESLLAIGTHDEHNQQPWPIFWSEHLHAELVSESLALQLRTEDAYPLTARRVTPESLPEFLKGKLIATESIYGAWRFRTDPASRYFRLPRATTLKGNWTSIISRWVPVGQAPTYSHWLMDALPRLALLPELPPDTSILVPARLADYQRESLKLLGVLDRCRPTTEKHLEIEHYFFSAPTAMLDCYNPYALKFLRNSFLSHADPNYSGPKRFFITRVGKTRQIENLEDVLAFFEKLGWSIIDTDGLPFAQEIKLFAEAEAFCTSTGSALSNAVFCSPGCAIVELAPDYILDAWVDWISRVLGLKYSFLICPSDYSRRLFVDMDRLRGLMAAQKLY
jgi:capsular polysaccharide biosynthesis protein